MLLIQLLRKLGKLVRGGVAPKQIVLGGLLGVLVGMIPGVNLSLVLAIVLLMLLNAHVGIALMGLGLGKAVSLLLAPVTFRIGYAIIHSVGLEGLFRAASDTAVVALLDLHVYCLVGGLPIAILLGIVFGWVVVKLVTAVRVGIVETTARSEKMQKLAKNPIVKLFLRIVFGKQKEDIAELLKKKPSLFRKSGVILAAVVLVIILLLQFLFLEIALKAGLERGLGSANGAEVNVEKADLSLLGGKLEVRGLQVTNREKPERNIVQVEQLTADVSISDLLRKRYVIALLAVRDVQIDSERAAPGRVFPRREDKDDEEDGAEGKDGPGIDVFEKVETVKEYLRKLKDYLKERERARTEEREKQKEKMLETAQNEGYLRLGAKGLLAEHPVWLIKEAKVEKVRVNKDMPLYALSGREIASHPELNPAPMTIEVRPQDAAEPIGGVAFGFHKPDAMHTAYANLKDVAVGETVKLSDKFPLDVKDGRADISLKGSFNSDSVNMPFDVKVTQLKADTREGERVLGMDAKTANEIFANLEAIEITGAVTGSLSSPRIHVDTKKLLEEIKGSLVKAGKRELMNRAEKEIDTLKDKLGDKVGDDLRDRLKDKLPGLRKDGPADDKKGGDKDKPKARDLLKGIL